MAVDCCGNCASAVTVVTAVDIEGSWSRACSQGLKSVHAGQPTFAMYCHEDPPFGCITSWSRLRVGLPNQFSRRAHMQAKNILIATGGRALVPPIEGKEHTIISDQILDLPKRPNK